MGANAVKHSPNLDVLRVVPSNEKTHIRDFFNSIAEPKVANLTILWQAKLDQHLGRLIINYLLKSKQKTTISFRDFELLFACIVRGTADDKSEVLIDMLTDCQRTEPIPRSALIQYLESLITSYILLHENYEWPDSTPAEVKCMAETLCGDLPSDITHERLSSWIASTPELCAVQTSVLGRLYSVKTFKPHIVPICDNKYCIPSIIHVTSAMYINAALPAALRDVWRMLFSSARHGESFSKLMGYITNQGPTVLIVRDKEGYVFGGFAPNDWAIGPNFVGDETSFLFRLKPTMHIYNSTQYNDHYQYVNTQQQTMPNGLGMGGQFGYWGMWIDAEYGTGQSSETCTTYRHFKMLSATKNFSIDHLEVWAVGSVSNAARVGSACSILDSNHDAKAFLDMIGKGATHSDGWREQEEDNY